MINFKCFGNCNNFDIIFDFLISGNATNFVDYNFTNSVNNQIVLLDGEATVSLNILAIYDELNEAPEDLVIEIPKYTINHASENG